MTVRIMQGHVLDRLAELPSESVHCVVTSPPFYGLRSYGTEPQIWGDDAWHGHLGLEPDYLLYVEHIVEVFRAVRRVLRPDGTVWLNLGDSYATGAGRVGQRPGGGVQGDRWAGYLGDGTRGHRGQHLRHQSGKAAPRIAAMGPMTQPNRMPQPGLKPKDLMGIPWRVAFALQNDGWWLRKDIIWKKPNPMPESVLDRPTTAHEYIFLLSRSEQYYYAAEAIRERAVADELGEMDGGPQRLADGSDANCGRNYRKPNAPDKIASPYGQGFTRLAKHGESTEDYDRLRGRQDVLHHRIGRKGNAMTFRGGGVYIGGRSFDNCASIERDSHGNAPNTTFSRNKRSVWTVATVPFQGAHFATFPPKLIEPCILAGCPVGGMVLDPFGGSGTTGLVAERLGRDAILIELNPEYVAMAERRCRQLGLRLAGAAGMFEAAAE